MHDLPGQEPKQPLHTKLSLSLRSTWQADEQSKNQVFLRVPGDRLLSGPRPAEPYAREHWEFAHLSLAAYQDTPAAILKQRPGYDANSVDSNGILARQGWVMRQDLMAQGTAASEVLGTPDKQLYQEGNLRALFERYHLRLEVWSHEASHRLAVSFGGTVFNNRNDWLANLRWLTPAHTDQYSLIVHAFAPWFASAYHRAFGRPDGTLDPWRTVYVTGHSLGGGLAQQFAFCLPHLQQRDDLVGPEVKQVYAFDPSPVTGFYSVPRWRRRRNDNGLCIERVYERGEVLALLRLICDMVAPPPAEHPQYSDVRYSLFYEPGFHVEAPITGHSIVDLAVKLTQMAGQETPTVTVVV